VTSHYPRRDVRLTVLGQLRIPICQPKMDFG
jgi:hypothetical protein